MKKLLTGFIALLLCPVILFAYAVQAESGEEEEEIHFYEPDWYFFDTPGEDDPAEGPQATPAASANGKVIFNEDGSVILTITAAGDVTIGKNVKASGKSIFQKELEKQDNDINFIFRNIRQRLQM